MSNIYITGDIHGNAPSFKQRIKYYIPNATKDDILICAGDVGLEYGSFIQSSLKKAMHQFPGQVYIIRGNHDNRYWANHTTNNEADNGWQIQSIESFAPHLIYQKKYDNIKYIRDEGDILSIKGNNILFIPGAFSIDGTYRLSNNLPYEYNEQLTYKEMMQLFDKVVEFTQYNTIDYVISHTAPLCTEKNYKDLFLDFIDQTQVNKSMEKFLDEIYTLIQKDVKHWYFGHYHDDRDIAPNFTMLYTEVVKLGDSIE